MPVPTFGLGVLIINREAVEKAPYVHFSTSYCILCAKLRPVDIYVQQQVLLRWTISNDSAELFSDLPQGEPSTFRNESGTEEYTREPKAQPAILNRASFFE
jgi:hypothetical protein